MPKFLVVLRVPVRMLGNALFPNGFEGFLYALCGYQTANEPTGIYSTKYLILLHPYHASGLVGGRALTSPALTGRRSSEGAIRVNRAKSRIA